jgi:hypothetical protein
MIDDPVALLERELVAAARRRVAGHPPRRRPTLGGLAVLVLVVVTLAVAGGAVVLLGGRGRSPASSAAAAAGRQRTQELSYIAAAHRQVAHTPDCQTRRVAGPLLNYGAPSTSLLSVLGVLRRPATSLDRSRRTLQDAGNARGIYVKYIRLALVEDGVSYYVVPVATLFPTAELPARCYAAVVAALRAELAGIPPSLRDATVSLEQQLIAQQRRFAQLAAGAGVCLVFKSADGDGGTCGASATEIEQQGLISVFGRLSGVVPDGVATVTVRYPVSNGHFARTATASVVGNVFAFATLRSSRGNPAAILIWRSANGRILKAVSESARPRAPGGGVCSARPGSNAC